MVQDMLAYVRIHTIKIYEFTAQKTAFEAFNAVSKTPYCIFIYDIVDELAVMWGTKETLYIREKYKLFHL